MRMNPYHYVPKKVVFSPIIKTNIINSRFNNDNIDENIENKIRTHSLNNKKKKFKTIDSQTISFIDLKFNSDELIWRLISRIIMTKGISSFKQAVKYEAITKVWKNHSLIIERLLVNYKNFKWFLEKDKIMNEKVLMEFLSLLKMNNKKGHEEFCRKIILIFDEEGEGNIKIKEFFFLMNLTSQTSLNFDKMNFLCSLFEDYKKINKNKSVNIEEIIDNFKVILNYETYRKDLRKLIDSIKNEFLKGKYFTMNNNNSESNYVEKDRVLKFLLENETVQMILKKFYRDYLKAHSSYNDEIMNVFYATMRNSKRMLNLHDIIEYCESDYMILEKNLKAIETKNDIIEDINQHEHYFKEEKEYK